MKPTSLSPKNANSLIILTMQSQKKHILLSRLCVFLGFLLLVSPTMLFAQLQPFPEPMENMKTPEKIILGKILFWEEQLSSDNAVACGTCHLPEAGGADPRSLDAFSVHPGPDGMMGTDDDRRGSIGVRAQDCNGQLLDDGSFFPRRQVTGRRAPSYIGVGFATDLFWDGRASTQFVDPVSNQVMIQNGGAYESQALGPIMSTAEMACDGRTWDDVFSKLENSTPLALARDIPEDMSTAISTYPSYPALFEMAFGDTEINATRIAFAIASYERALLPDQTRFDDWLAGDFEAMTMEESFGFDLFHKACQLCHDTNDLSDGNFHNIGVRPSLEDTGLEAITGLAADLGKFKTPPLRNSALRAPYFHDGSALTLREVVEFYNRGGDFDDNLDPEIRKLNFTEEEIDAVTAFISDALTDARVANGEYPFDHPTLQAYFQRGDVDGSRSLGMEDPMQLLTHLFGDASVEGLPCLDAADANDDGRVDISDSLSMLLRIFALSNPLPAPGDRAMGPDPTADSLDCEIESLTFSF